MSESATIKEIVEYGLDKIPSKQTITIELKDFMYIQRVLEEYMRFFHQPSHYPTIESLTDFLGNISSGGGFEVLNAAIYNKIYKIALPKEIEQLMGEGTFEHPLFPKYYNSGKN